MVNAFKAAQANTRLSLLLYPSSIPANKTFGTCGPYCVNALRAAIRVSNKMSLFNQAATVREELEKTIAAQ